MTIRLTSVADPVRETMTIINVWIDIFDQLCEDISEGDCVLIGDMSTMAIYHA